MEEHERHSALMLDEIQLSAGLAYDQTTGEVFGRPTLALADGTLPDDAVATHGLVFMLGGVTTRWKQTIAYHLTGNSFSSAAAKDVVLEIIRLCEKIGVRIDAIVSDMGGGNQGLWREFGIVVGQYSRKYVCCPHPCDSSRQLYFMADVAHLLKNLRNHLSRGQSIFLPDNVVRKHAFTTNEVNLKHVKTLLDIDSALDLNLAPHLKPGCLDPGHFEKMKVSLAYSLFNHDKAAAIRYLVHRGDISEDALATAWFFEVCFKWFKVMSSRTTKLAISRLDDQKYSDILDFLREMIHLFEKLIIGKTSKSVWKPVQTGIILVTTVALQLQDYYLNKKGFFCVLFSRFGQDALENLFSTLRSKNPVPRPLEFRSALRAATMAQFLRPSKHGSYADAAGHSLAGLSAKTLAPDKGVITPSITSPRDILCLGSSEQQSLDYLAGYVVHNVEKNTACCDVCKAALRCKTVNTLTQLKSFTDETRLVTPSPAVVQLLECAENLFRANSTELLQNKLSIAQIEESAMDMVTSVGCFPSCHDVQRKLLKVFFRTRMHILIRKENERALSQKASVKCGSRSVAKQVATTNVK